MTKQKLLQGFSLVLTFCLLLCFTTGCKKEQTQQEEQKQETVQTPTEPTLNKIEKDSAEHKEVLAKLKTRFAEQQKQWEESTHEISDKYSIVQKKKGLYLLDKTTNKSKLIVKAPEPYSEDSYSAAKFFQKINDTKFVYFYTMFEKDCWSVAGNYCGIYDIEKMQDIPLKYKTERYSAGYPLLLTENSLYVSTRTHQSTYFSESTFIKIDLSFLKEDSYPKDFSKYITFLDDTVMPHEDENKSSNYTYFSLSSNGKYCAVIEQLFYDAEDKENGEYAKVHVYNLEENKLVKSYALDKVKAEKPYMVEFTSNNEAYIYLAPTTTMRFEKKPETVKYHLLLP